jgi:hypothetical protein
MYSGELQCIEGAQNIMYIKHNKYSLLTCSLIGAVKCMLIAAIPLPINAVKCAIIVAMYVTQNYDIPTIFLQQ